MKKKITILAMTVLLFVAHTCLAQVDTSAAKNPPPPPKPQSSGPPIYFTATGGYVFKDKVTLDNGGTGYIGDGFVWGVILTIEPVPRFSFDLKYHHQDFTGSYSYSGITNKEVDASANYIMLGFNKQVPMGDSRFFTGFDIGTCLFSPKSDGYSDVWKFAVGGKLGVKVFITPKVGILVQTNLDIPVQFVSGGLYFGTGGAGAGVSTSSSITQFGFTGGLIFRLK